MRRDFHNAALDELNTVLDAHAADGDFDRDWRQAMARESTARSWARVAAPVAAAAAVLLWVGWSIFATPTPAFTEPLVDDAQAASARPADPNALSMGAGHTQILELSAVPRSISVILPEVARVQNLGLDRRVLVEGMKRGRTDIVVTYPDGETETHPVVVTDRPHSPRTSGWADVEEGGVLLLESQGVSALSITDPEVLKALNLGNGLIVLRAQKKGSTDVIVHREGEVTALSVSVGKGPRRHPALTLPDATDLEVSLGSARILQLDAVRSVSIARPERASIQATGKAGEYRLSGESAGVTSMVVLDEDQSVKTFRIVVR